MDGIEDNGDAFQFNVEQSDTMANVAGKVSELGQQKAFQQQMLYAWLNKH